MSKHKYSKEFLERTGIKLDEINPGKSETPEVVAKVPTDLKERSVGLARVKDTDSNNYTYLLTEVTYDVVNKVAGEVKVLFETRSKEEAVNNFKFLVDEFNLFYYER